MEHSTKGHCLTVPFHETVPLIPRTVTFLHPILSWEPAAAICALCLCCFEPRKLVQSITHQTKHTSCIHVGGSLAGWTSRDPQSMPFQIQDGHFLRQTCLLCLLPSLCAISCLASPTVTRPSKRLSDITVALGVIPCLFLTFTHFCTSLVLRKYKFPPAPPLTAFCRLWFQEH